MTTQNDLELDPQLDADDAAFDDGAGEDFARAPRRKSPLAKMLAGVAVIGLALGGGWYAYQNFINPAATPVAANVPADVPAGQVAGMPAPVDPMAAADPLMAGDPMAADPMATDPMAAGMPADGSAPVDPAMMAADGSALPPGAPMAPDAVTGAVDPMAMPDAIGAPDAAGIADPMMAGDPNMAADPNAAPVGADAGVAIDPITGLPMQVDAQAAMNGDMGAPAMPDGIAAPVDAAADTPAAPLEQPAGADPAIAQPVTDTPVDVAMPAPDAPAPVTPETMPVADAPAINAAANAELQQQVNTLESRLAELEGALATLRERAAAPAAVTSGGVSQADFDALSRRLDELSSAQQQRAESRSVPAAVIEEAPVRSNVLAPNPMPKLAVPSLRKPAPATKNVVTPATRSNWQLRSAQPGRAWIAESGSQEMRSVGTGDTVPGLGRILSITQDSAGKWTVNGTAGSVRQ